MEGKLESFLCKKASNTVLHHHLHNSIEKEITMKRMYVLMSVVLLISFVLSACGAKATPAPAPAAPATAAPAAPAATEKPAAPAGPPITLEYWQVDFAGWDTAIGAVIKMFEAENPNIKVNYTPISYDEINEKIAAMVPIGQGPDLVNPFFGWVPLWAKSGFLAPLPEDMFPKADMENLYLPAINAQYYDGKLWGLPLNQSNWAIWYNKDFFKEIGVTKLPETWAELRDAAIKCTKRDASGKLLRAGYFVSFGTQEHILWKVLSIKNGQPIFSADQKKVTWNDSATGLDAFKFVADLIKVDKVIDVGFADDSPGSAFYTGQTCMRLGSPGNLPVIRKNAPTLNFGSFPLPKGTASDAVAASKNQTQYWSFNMTAKAAADPARLAASLKFMKFLTKPEVAMAYITNGAGGLPAHKALLADPYFAKDAELKAFLDTLPNSTPLFWVDEKGERQIVIDAADKVLLNDEDYKTVFDALTKSEQEIRDTFFSK
jgi:multiple sugar transport system substrate-binding protein